MIDKTRGIVLHQLKYTDSGIIVWIYTRKYGRNSFILKGARNKKQGKHNIFFQPLSVLDMVVYLKESREINSIKEFSAAYIPSDIYLNVKKSGVAIFLGEVLSAVLKEETPNEVLFDFIENGITYFDTNYEGYANFHISFLSGLLSYLGFEPTTGKNIADTYFDMLNGIFTASPPAHEYIADKEVSAILARFFTSSYEEANKIILNGAMRNIVLDNLIRYYSLHLPGLKNIKSLRVLKEVYG
ncbi:MAG TPA: DNA repair protein RecO [Bacteroidales bacterium]|nr:DNA repair protein RecO [Bacteroidales bacterium]